MRANLSLDMSFTSIAASGQHPEIILFEFEAVQNLQEASEDVQGRLI